MLRLTEIHTGDLLLLVSTQMSLASKPFISVVGSNYLYSSTAGADKKAEAGAGAATEFQFVSIIIIFAFTYTCLSVLKASAKISIFLTLFYLHCREVALGVAEDSSLSKFYSVQ